MESLVLKLLIWALLWGVAGATFVWLVRRGINYIEGFGITATLFLGLTVVAGFAFRDLIWPRLSVLGPAHAALLVFLLGGQAIAYRIGRRFLPQPHRFLKEHPHIYFLRLDDRYLVSKSFEILFQQTMVAALVLMLAGQGLSHTTVAVLCALTFGVAHIPLIALVGRGFGLFYLGSAVVAGAVFSLLILSGPAGLVYSYIVHWLYYTVSGIGFWLVLGRGSHRLDTVSRLG